MYVKTSCSLILYLLALISFAFTQEIHSISQEELKDKIAGYWMGQLVGNYVGFPFENLYDEEPIPVFVDRYMNYQDADTLGLKMNLNDRRAFVDIMAQAMGGAWSDDDTDIEFVTLHGLEQYGLDITYEEIALLRKKHINRFIWSSNALVHDLLIEGHLPPETGSKALNEHWYTLGSQLTNEIWGAVYPGMTDLAADRAEWAARVTHDSWATHGTVLYVSMYSAAYFEQDVDKLLEIGMSKLPDDSPYLEAVQNVIRWHSEYPNWKDTRKRIHDAYYQEFDGFDLPYPMGSAAINGLNGIMALLYGDGDFTQSIAIATTTGYDCDNQAATIGGLLGVMHGASSIPDRFTLELPSRGKWTSPFNDTYVNYSRDHLPNYNKISDIVTRILQIAEVAILEQGGEKVMEQDKILYRIVSDME